MTTLTLLTFNPTKRHSRTKHCRKCDVVISEGNYRAVIRHKKTMRELEQYCPKCVAFIHTRYSFTFSIPDLTKEELGYVKLFS